MPKKKQKKAQKETEPQFYKSETGLQTMNYRVYHMRRLEKILYFVAAFLAGAFVGYLFYGGVGKNEFGVSTGFTYIWNGAVMVIVGFAAGKAFLLIREKQLQVARQNKLKSQFRDMLEAVATSLGAGKNVPESFSSAYQDLKNQYEENAFILNELKIINVGLVNGSNIETLLENFGSRSGCEDIQDFASVFEICFRKGGNIKETVRITYEILSDKMTVAEEIETIVAGSKSEQTLMLIMPVLLIAMIKMMSSDFASNFTTPTGLMATTVALAIFVASYLLGRKVLDIKI